MAWGNHLLFYAWNIKIKYQMGKWILLYKGWEQHRKDFVGEGELAGKPEWDCRAYRGTSGVGLDMLRMPEHGRRPYRNPQLFVPFSSRDMPCMVLTTRGRQGMWVIRDLSDIKISRFSWSLCLCCCKIRDPRQIHSFMALPALSVFHERWTPLKATNYQEMLNFIENLNKFIAPN